MIEGKNATELQHALLKTNIVNLPLDKQYDLPKKLSTYPYSLTLWELAYDIFVLWFQPKKQQFSVSLPTP